MIDAIIPYSSIANVLNSAKLGSRSNHSCITSNVTVGTCGDELSCGGERRGEIHKIPTLIPRARRAAAIDGPGRAWYIAGHEPVPTMVGKSGRCQEG